jgi:predicted CoA-binding protein
VTGAGSMIPAMEDAIRWCLSQPRTWAVVGCSPSPFRDSNGIAELLLGRGHTVIPVNPEADEVLGLRCYPSLADVPGAVDVVDVFRRSDAAGGHVDEAIAMGARAVWLQLGVIDHSAAERAASAGLHVVMDRCPRIEYPRLAARGGR